MADGRYQLTILGDPVTGANGLALDGDANGTAGSDYVSPADTLGGGPGQLHLYRLFGDVNGDGVVDQIDLGQVRKAFNTSITDPFYLSFLDADNSGTIDQGTLASSGRGSTSTSFDRSSPLGGASEQVGLFGVPSRLSRQNEFHDKPVRPVSGEVELAMIILSPWSSTSVTVLDCRPSRRRRAPRCTTRCLALKLLAALTE